MSVDIVMVYIRGIICLALRWMFDLEGKPQTILGEGQISPSAMTGFCMRTLGGRGGGWLWSLKCLRLAQVIIALSICVTDPTAIAQLDS